MCPTLVLPPSLLVMIIQVQQKGLGVPFLLGTFLFFSNTQLDESLSTFFLKPHGHDQVLGVLQTIENKAEKKAGNRGLLKGKSRP